MKKFLHTLATWLLALTLFVGVLAFPAQAAEEPMDVTIPVTVEVTGSEPVSGAYAEFLFTALTENAPMPEGAEGGSLRLTVPLSQMGSNGFSIQFAVPSIGIYEYTLQMVDGTYYHEEDGSLYYVEAYNLAEGYEDVLVVYTSSGEEKVKGFPGYTIPLRDLTTMKRWIDTSFPGTQYVDIDVLLNEKPVELAVLAQNEEGIQEKTILTVPPVRVYSGNNWQNKWTGLDARADGQYSVKEVKVPNGYLATYRESDGIFIVSNNRILRQTGQLNWPIPVLAAAGSVMLAAGWLLLRKKEEENG